MNTNPFNCKEVNTFNLKELHRKIGQIVLSEPTDSDIQEGNCTAQLMFMTEDLTIYIIDEWDIRKERKND